MFNVIRIPTKFSKLIKRMSDQEKLYLLNNLIDIGDGKTVTPADNMAGDTLSLIYGEWMNMESKNGNKREKSIIQYTSEGPAEVCPSDPGTRVEYSRVEESRIEENRLEENKITISNNETNVSEVPDKRNKDVQTVIDAITEYHGSMGGSPGKERQFANHLAKKIKKHPVYTEMRQMFDTDEGAMREFIINLIERADNFQKRYTVSATGLYYHMEEIIVSNSKKSIGVIA